MKEHTLFIIVFIVCLLGMLTVTMIQKENLIVENEFLKAENHMLKTALADFGAEIEELSTTVDNLQQEMVKETEWNNNMEGF